MVRGIKLIFLLISLCTLYVSCAKKVQSQSSQDEIKKRKIDYLCANCEEEYENKEKKGGNPREENRRRSEELAKAKEIKEPLIFEYDIKKDELSIKRYEEMFDKAMALYSEGEIEKAGRIFRILAEYAPFPEYKEIALFNLALSLERMGEDGEAEKIYTELIKSPEYEIRSDSYLRLARIKISRGEFFEVEPEKFFDSERKNFANALKILQDTEKMIGDLYPATTSDEIKSEAEKGNEVEKEKEEKKKEEIYEGEREKSSENQLYSKISEKSEGEKKGRAELDRKSEEVKKAEKLSDKERKKLEAEINKIEKNLEKMLSQTGEKDTRSVIYIALGNVYFLKSIITPNYPISEVERKAQYLLTAQRNYFKVVRDGEAWWITAGVFKLGETYKFLYEDLVNSPIPPELETEEERRMYKVELVKELKKALDYAYDIYRKNIDFAERVKLKTVWIKKSKSHLEKIKVFLDEAKRIIEEEEENKTETQNETKRNEMR